MNVAKEKSMERSKPLTLNSRRTKRKLGLGGKCKYSAARKSYLNSSNGWITFSPLKTLYHKTIEKKKFLTLSPAYGQNFHGSQFCAQTDN